MTSISPSNFSYKLNNQTTTWHWRSDFGNFVSVLPDVNGDGTADLVVGNPNQDGTTVT